MAVFVVVIVVVVEVVIVAVVVVVVFRRHSAMRRVWVNCHRICCGCCCWRTGPCRVVVVIVGVMVHVVSLA